MEKFELSQYQKDIMNYIDSTNSNLLVDAKAGSGKTSTLILVSEKLNQQNQNSIFLSFNKSIVEELQEKLPDSIVKTIHSLGMTFIRSYLYKKHNKNYVLEVDSSGTKLRTLCKEYYDKYFKQIVTEINKDIMSADDLTKLHTDLVNDFISVCNFIRLYGNDYGDVEQVRKIVRKFTNSLAEASDEYLTNYYELVIAVLDKTIELFQNPSNTNSLGQPIYVIDFVDMIYFPVYFNMSIPYSLKDSLDTVLTDECIPEIHFVETKQGKMMFRELKRKVDRGEYVLVKTFNENTEQFEYKPAVSVTDKGVRPVYEITTTGLNKIQATDNHPFMTQNGWKQLKDLVIGEDYLYLDKPDNQKTKYIPNDDQLQIILGSALGDGSLQKASNNKYEFRIRFSHGEKQLDYLKFKQHMLHCKEPYITRSGYTQKNNIYATTSKMFLLPYNSKIDFIKHLDLRGIAILYMDDGSKVAKYNYSNVHISCNSFNLEETNALINKLKEYGINSINVPNKNYNELHIDSNNAKILFEKIAPYMHYDCYYKNPNSTGNYNWNNNWKSYGGNVVKSIEYVGNKKVLDMEIEDNHNFFISKCNQKNGSSILVHNCQDLSLLQQMFVSRLNTGTNRFIFVGDRNQSIYAFSGADTHSIDRLKYNFQPKELPLSICYRCPKKIIKLAQQIVPSIEWNPNREDTGHLEAITYTEMKKMLKPNDILIGRRNKDLLKIYKDFTLGDKKQIKFKNKELVNSIIKSLTNCIKDYMLLYAKGQNIDKVVYEHMMEFSKKTHYDAKTKEYKNEMNDFIKQYAKEHSVTKTKKPIMKANQTLDYLQKCMEEFKEYGAYEYDLECDSRQYYDIIMEFINEYKSKHVSVLVDDFIYYLKDFLNGSNNYTDVPIISSVHSMKGGEANRVFIYDYPKFPYEFRDMSDDEKQQERNLQYVAITRAKKELFLMLLDPKDAPNEDMVQWYEDKNKECQQMVKLINQTS